MKTRKERSVMIVRATALLSTLLFSLACFAEIKPKPGGVIEVPPLTSANEILDFFQTVGKPVLIDIKASWCPPCQKMKPIVEDFANRYGDQVQVMSIDGDENPGVATALLNLVGSSGYPTFLMVRGEPNGRFAITNAMLGGQPKDVFEQWTLAALAKTTGQKIAERPAGFMDHVGAEVRNLVGQADVSAGIGWVHGHSTQSDPVGGYVLNERSRNGGALDLSVHGAQDRRLGAYYGMGSVSLQLAGTTTGENASGLSGQLTAGRQLLPVSGWNSFVVPVVAVEPANVRFNLNTDPMQKNTFAYMPALAAGVQFGDPYRHEGLTLVGRGGGAFGNLASAGAAPMAGAGVYLACPSANLGWDWKQIIVPSGKDASAVDMDLVLKLPVSVAGYNLGAGVRSEQTNYGDGLKDDRFFVTIRGTEKK